MFWFTFLRPRREAARRATELSSSLEVGDEVVTIGGLYGTIVTIDDREVELEVAEGSHVALRPARDRRQGAADVDEDGRTSRTTTRSTRDDDLEDDGELGDEDEAEDNFEPDERRMKSRSSRPHRMPTNHPVVDALD